MPKRYLFVCSANCDRSPTAEKLMKELAAEHGLNVEVKSAGLHVGNFGQGGSVQLPRELCEWADEIYVMEQSHLVEVIREYGQPAEKVTSLDIDDIYVGGSAKLVDKLRPELLAILETPANSKRV